MKAERYIVILWVAATIALCAICVRQHNEINSLGTRIESVKLHGLKLILNLQKVVYSDHAQIIICPHQVDRNRRLSKEQSKGLRSFPKAKPKRWRIIIL